MRLARAILLGLLPLAFNPGRAAEEAPSEPIKNFVSATFTPQNYRSMLVRGSAARMLTPRLVQLDDTNLTIFSGDASNSIDSVLLSPVAIISLDDDTAHGPGAVRLIRNDLDLTGEQWIYDRAHKKISIARNVHVVFNTELKDMLK